MTTVGKKSLAKLLQWMKDQGMEPYLREALLSHLESWAMDAPPSSNYTNLPFLDNQSRIGWDRMLDGWLSCY